MDLSWQDGVLAEAEIRNVTSPDGELRVLYQDRNLELKIARGKSKSITLSDFK
jgi:hypothetical protein